MRLGGSVRSQVRRALAQAGRVSLLESRPVVEQAQIVHQQMGIILAAGGNAFNQRVTTYDVDGATPGQPVSVVPDGGAWSSAVVRVSAHVETAGAVVVVALIRGSMTGSIDLQLIIHPE